MSAITATAVGGILHILMVPRSLDREFEEGIFFLISGILQVFWILPIIKNWNRIWYYVGIGGTAILFALWIGERIPRLVDGGGIRLSSNTLAIEGFQIAFIVLCIILLKRKSNEKEKTLKPQTN
jgi:hypothetical protein